jgi:hypothetical protein
MLRELLVFIDESNVKSGVYVLQLLDKRSSLWVESLQVQFFHDCDVDGEHPSRSFTG